MQKLCRRGLTRFMILCLDSTVQRHCVLEKVKSFTDDEREVMEGLGNGGGGIHGFRTTFRRIKWMKQKCPQTPGRKKQSLKKRQNLKTK